MEKEIPEELWAETTWEGNRRAQLRRALDLTVRERLQAIEDMGDIARRFAEMRDREEFHSSFGLAREPQIDETESEKNAP